MPDLDLMEIGNTVKEAFFSDDEIEEKLLEVKKSIAKEYISEIKKGNQDIEDHEDLIENYLINDGSVEDTFKDVFRGCFLSITFPEVMDNLKKVKEKISSITESTTEESLSSLKSEIMNLKLHETTGSETQQSIESNTGSSEVPQSTPEIMEQENKFIKSVYNRASRQIGKDYKRGGVSPSSGFDCSGLWYRAFKEEGIRFSQRLTAHGFSDADVDLRKEQVKTGDFMFWDQKSGKKKHDSIYHIEMIISKPYTKNGKTYVKTLGSSTDTKDDCGKYVGRGVQTREREMKDHRHYGRPTYYYQLAQNERTGSSSDLVATANRPSQDLASQVLSA